MRKDKVPGGFCHAPSKAPKTFQGRFLSLFLIWRLNGRPQHGYSLIREVGGLSLTPSRPSTIYAVLAKLEKSGMIKAFHENSASRRRKMYRTTAKGAALFEYVRQKRSGTLLMRFLRVLAN